MPEARDQLPSDSYAEWLRRQLKCVNDMNGRALPLFGSSVREPLPLLQAVVSGGFAGAVTDRYHSTFVAGNRVVTRHLCERYGVDQAQLLCTTGATTALSTIYRALLAPGDRILVESPGFDVFDYLARENGVAVDRFPRRGDRFEIDFEALEAGLCPETRLIVVSNLHNPSGMLLSAGELARLARIAESHDLFIVVDEVYADYAAGSPAFSSATGLSPRCIVVSSLTKIYGLGSLRCGWAVASEAVIARLRDYSDRYEFGVSALAHGVAALVLDEAARFDAYWQRVMAAARPVMQAFHADWIREGLIEGALPEFGCICFPRLVGVDDTQALARWLSERHGVFVVPGEYFGQPGNIRLGYAHSPETLRASLLALGEGLRHYRPV